MTGREAGAAAQFVVKITKYCNLRCTYCYEFPDLGNRHRISLEMLGQIFENIAASAGPDSFDTVNFVWHGGEPFMIPLAEYDAIGRLQRTIFGSEISVSNVLQTNLTILTPEHLQHLKAKTFFSGIGVSFDVHGDQRVDKKGKLKTEVVLNNMQKLLDNDIRFGAIAVLARNTLPHVRNIYRFYDRLGVESRFLPFYQSASEQQRADHSMTFDELVKAFEAIFDEWLVSEHATAVDPIDDLLSYAISFTAGYRQNYYDKEADELIFVVDLDGGTWGPDEIYGNEYKYGNLASERFSTILASGGRRRALDRARSRQELHCRPCQYFGACPGFFVADASPHQQSMIAEHGCPIRPVLDHIVETIANADLSEVILAQASTPRSRNLALVPNL